jgi:branched-chain amino acid transport system ATP-binding protein
MLKIMNISKSFGGVHALNEVSLFLERGKIWSLIGPNGAGKTTLFNVITGTLTADSGEVEFIDENITNMKPYDVCRKGIARTYQLKNLFPHLTVYENIVAGMFKDSIDEKQRGERVDEILEFLGLQKHKYDSVAALSPLASKLVELGRALATNPQLILLDELIGGLLPAETDKICEIVETLRDRDQTIFQIGHEMGPIMKTSDWIFVLDEGRKIAEGTPKAIKENQDVHEVYLE